LAILHPRPVTAFADKVTFFSGAVLFRSTKRQGQAMAFGTIISIYGNELHKSISLGMFIALMHRVIIFLLHNYNLLSNFYMWGRSSVGE
jgi:hypothetical protein